MTHTFESIPATLRSGPLDVVLLFDVEDVFSAPEVGNDDSIKELADILTEEGLTGTFLFIADRALHLQARGRSDVIAAVARHEVGLHTRSARHPCAPEYAASRSWDEAVAETLRRECEGGDIIERVFGQPCCALSAHNVFTSPMAHHVAGLLGKPYVYAYAQVPPLRSLCWYAGALCLPAWTDAGETDFTRAHFYGFDDTYPDTPRFEEQLTRFDEWVDRALAEGQYFMSLFMYHPQRLRLREFIDHFWAPNGTNFPDTKRGAHGSPRRYTEAEVTTARNNFRRLVQRVRSDPRLRPTTLRDVAARHGVQPAVIRRDELIAAARETAAAGRVMLNPRFSPAELSAAFAEALLACAGSGALPADVPRKNVLGPTTNPVIEPELRDWSWDELLGLAREFMAHVERTARLPANFGSAGCRVGINHVHVALAEAVVARSDGRWPPRGRFRRMPRCPTIADELGRRFLSIADGELVDPDMDVDGLYRHGRLQAWSLKPAIAAPRDREVA